MIEPKIKESGNSWRPKRWLMITEGRKLKVTSNAVKIAIWCLGILVLIFQGYGLFRPQVKQKVDTAFVPPELRQATPPTYIPKVMNREEELAIEKEKARAISAARKGTYPAIERIRAVNLGVQPGVPAGSETLVTLVSGGATGMVKAILTENLKSDGDVILPARTVLLGVGTSSDDRLFMEFSKAILPDRSTLRVKALAYDQEDRILGVRGKKISDYAFKLAASSGLIFLGGMADGMREDVNLMPGERRRPSARDAALTGVTTATSEVGKDMLEKMKASDSRVEVAHSTTALVIFDEVPKK